MMSLKDLIYNSYGKEIYKTTRELQRKKIKAAISKNQLIFLEKCLTYDVPRSRLESNHQLNRKKPFASPRSIGKSYWF